MRSRAIEAYKQTLVLTTEQRQTLVGILLGDAHLESQLRGRTWRLKVEQSDRHADYVQHLYRLFQPWVLSPPRKRSAVASTGTATASWTFQTVSHAALRFYAHQFYAGGRKRVPKLIHRWLTPRGLAYWLMDDGSRKSGQSLGVIFNTQGFDAACVERLIAVLQSKFELQATVRRQKEGNQIYVSGRSFERLVKWIEPFVIESMRYKLPHSRRTYLPKE